MNDNNIYDFMAARERQRNVQRDTKIKYVPYTDGERVSRLAVLDKDGYWSLLQYAHLNEVCTAYDWMFLMFKQLEIMPLRKSSVYF